MKEKEGELKRAGQTAEEEGCNDKRRKKEAETDRWERKCEPFTISQIVNLSKNKEKLLMENIL